jgi:hypothetical protein
VVGVLIAHLREIRRRFVSEILVPVSSSERGDMRALSKADRGRTDRFSRDLLLFSRLAALEDCLFRQGTRKHGVSRRRRRTGLCTAFAVLLGVSDHRVRSRVFLVPQSVDAARPIGIWGENAQAPPIPVLGQ